MKNPIIIISLLITTILFSQKKEHFVIPDSLKKMSFEELDKKFNESLLNRNKKVLYANVYYKKSKQQHDKIIIANGLYMMAYALKNYDLLLAYTDSIITLTKNYKNPIYPARAYVLRSEVLFDHNLNEALANALAAEKYLNESNNVEQSMMLKQQIGLIKIELGKPEEALHLLLDSYNYYKSRKSGSAYYLYSGWILSDIYNHLNKPDTAIIYINTFLEKIEKKNPYYKYFLLNKGISYHIKKQYDISNRLLDESTPLIKLSDDKLNLAIGYYYRGENILQGKKNILKAKKYFEQVDSILLTTQQFTGFLRNNYLNLIEISKTLKEDKQQLYYLNRLLEIDNRLNKNNVVLSENMIKNYDTPHILAEKEEIITKIKKEKQFYTGIGFVIFIGLSFSLYFLRKTRKKNQLYENRFNELMNETRSEIIPDNIITEDNKIKSFDLPKVISKDLLQKLVLFEKEQGYLELNLKLNDLSKQFKTNSSYLSKIINQYKGKNFNQYINDLRIAFVIKKLKADKKFRKYTIRAIAEEVGFSNTESFAKAFFHKTGIQPSYFIKKIDSHEKNK